MAEKINPKQAQKKETETPSGQFDSPIEVALTGSMLGGSTKSFESLIVNSMAQLIYGGDSASSVFTLGQIKSMTAKENPMYFLSSLNKKFEQALEDAESLKKRVLEPMSTGIGQLQLYTAGLISMLGSGIPVRAMKDPNAGGVVMGEGGDGKANKVEVVLKGNNAEEVLKALAELSDEDTFGILATAFEEMVNQSEGFKTLSEYVQPFTEYFSTLIGSNDKLSEFTELLDPLGKGFKSLEGIKKVDLEAVEQLGNSMVSLSTVNIDKNQINTICSSLTTVSETLNSIDTSKLDVDKFQPIVDVVEKLSVLEKVKDIDLSPIDILITQVPRINDLMQEIGKIKKIKEKSLTNFNSFVDFVANIDYGDSPTIPKEFTEHLRLLNDLIIPRMQSIIPMITSINLSKVLEKKLENLAKYINLLGSIDLGKSNFSFKTGLDKDFNNFTKVIPSLEKIINGFKEFTVTKTVQSNIEQTSKVFENLAKIKYEGKQNIDVKALDDFVFNALPEINEVFKEFAEQKQTNYKTTIANIAQISKMLEYLQNMEFDNDVDIDTESLEEIVKAIPHVNRIASQLNLNYISKETVNSSDFLVKLLDSMRSLRFDTTDPINSKALIDINQIMPTIIEICEKLNNVSVSDSPKNVKDIIKTLNILQEIDTAPFEDKDLKPVIECIVAFNNISDSLNKIDDDAALKADSLKTLVECLITDKTSPLKQLVNEDLSQIVNKIDDAKKLSDLIESLAKTAKAVGALGALGPMITTGTSVLKQFITSIKDIVGDIEGNDAKKIEAAMKTMKGVCTLIAVSTICMIIGGAFIVFMPKLVIGALAFGLVLGLFLAVTLKAISWASKDLQTSMETMKGVALLITVSTFVMLIGAAFVIGFPKLIIGALAFTIILGMFIMATLQSIRVGTMGMKEARKDLRDMIVLIGVCAFVMMVGAAFVLLQPKLIAGAMMFTVVLGLFIMATLQSIRVGTMGMKRRMHDLKQMAILIGSCAFIMMIGAAIVLAFPQIIAGAMMFTVVLGLFIFATLTAIRLGTKGMKKVKTKAKEFAIIIGICAGVLLAGGGLFVAFPDLIWGTTAFGAIFAAFVFVMGKAMKQLGKQGKDIMKGSIAMAILSGVILVTSTSLLIIRKAMDGGILEVVAGALVMSATLGIVALMTVAMGSAAANPFFWMGVGAMAAVSGIILMAATSMLLIAQSMKIFKEVGQFDLKPTLTMIMGFIEIATALIPVGLLAPVVVAASLAVSSLSIAIALISAAVAEAASLKIPIYEGTKKVGYRQLQQKDFTDAGKNVKAIVSTLGKAMIDLYKQSPEMFADPLFGDNPFTCVVKSTSKLSELISKISHAVKDYASLKIPIYEGTKVVGYKHLNDKDFTSAANNVKTVVLTLSNALIELYNEHPEMFKDNSIFSVLGTNPGNTPLSCVIAVTKKLGPLISSIAHGVADMAKLKIPTAYNNEGKAISFRQMTDKEIQQAGVNTKSVILTLSNALIELYGEHPEMFKDKSIFSFMGAKPGNTPLSIVISVTKKLGSLISEIAKGVQDMANLKIPIEYNKDGKAIKFRSMTDKEIQQAGVNTKAVINTLASALIELHDENPEMFKDTSIFSFMGAKPGNTKLSMVISVTKKLGSLISEIAEGVQDMANLKIPIEYNKDGKAIKFRQMTDAEIEQAGTNVAKVVSILGNSLMTSYEQHQDWYKAPESLFGSIFGGGGGAKKTPFYTVVATNLKLADLISKIGDAVGKMAKLTVPTEWDKEGKIVGYRTLNEQDFDAAGANIGKIITVLGNAVMQQYEDHKDWFENEDGDLMKDGKNKFSIVMKSTKGLSEIIKNIASAVKDYSKLLIPDKWDEKGNAIHYRELTPQDFENAGKNIGTIITTVGNAMMEVYNGNEEWFQDKGGFLGMGGESDFSKILTACTSMGEMISNISSGVTALAQLMIPTKWNAEGNPVEFRQMKWEDFDEASRSIKTVVSTVGNALIELYDGRPDLFETGEDNPDSKFAKVAEGCSYLGTMIKGIAEGVVQMATLENTLKKEGIDFGADTYKAAAQNIADVVSVLGEALMNTFGAHKEWFENPPIIETSVGFFSSKTTVKPDNSDTPFQKVVKGCSLMGSMIMSIAEGISFFAKATQAGIQQPDGTTIQMDIPKATENIGMIIETVGGAIMKVANSGSFYTIDKLEPIINAVKKSSEAVFSVATLLEKIGTGTISILDKDGNPLKELKLDENTITQAATTIGNVISGVSAGFVKAKEESSKSEFSFFNSHAMKVINELLDNVNKAITIVGNNVMILHKLGGGSVVNIDKDGKEIGKPRTFKPEDLEKGSETIATILTKVAEGVGKAYDIFEDRFGWWLSDNEKGIIELMLNSTDKAMKIVGASAQSLAYLGSGLVPVGELTVEGFKSPLFIKVDDNTFSKGAEIVANVLTTIAKAVGEASSSVSGFVGWGSQKWEETLACRMLKAVEQAKSTVGGMALFLSHLGNGEYVYFDTRYKKERSVPVTYESLNTASLMVAAVLENIAYGVGNGAKAVESVNIFDIIDLLVGVDGAVNTIGKHALFLSHLGNGKYIYFDTRYKKERSVPVTVEGMHNAGLMISTLLSEISYGIGNGARSLEGLNFFDIIKMLGSVEQAKNTVGRIALFVSHLGNGEYVYRDILDGLKEKSVPISEASAKTAANIIKTIITSIADAISYATDKLNDSGFNLFGKSDDDKISTMFKALNKATSMLGRISKVVSYYANGEIVEVTVGSDGKASFERAGAPNVEVAKKNIQGIVIGLTDIIKDASERINDIDDIDTTIENLHKSMKVIDASVYAINAITNVKDKIDQLQGFSFGSIMTPVLNDIDKVFEHMNNLGQSKDAGSIFGGLLGQAEDLSPFRKFIADANLMIMQSLAISAAPVEKSYNTLNTAIKSTMDTMSVVKMPENFGKQVEDLSKFVRVVNTIKIEGVDSLTELLKELNKMGINMGNLDKLTNALANKLTVTIKEVGKIMDSLNKTMIEDGKRKAKHKEEIKKSVKEIKDAMSQTMQVMVTMDNSNNSSLQTDSPNNDTNSTKTSSTITL